MNEDVLYDEVAKELQAKAMVPGVWARAFEKAGGEMDRARALYIKYRVEQLAQARNQRLEEEKLAALEATKQKTLSRFRRFTYGLLTVLCGLLTFIFGFSIIIFIIPLILTERPTEAVTIVGMIGGVVFMAAVSFLFGLATYKCHKAWQR